MFTLPNEIIYTICTNLNIIDNIKILSTCKYFNVLVNNNFWKNYINDKYNCKDYDIIEDWNTFKIKHLPVIMNINKCTWLDVANWIMNSKKIQINISCLAFGCSTHYIWLYSGQSIASFLSNYYKEDIISIYNTKSGFTIHLRLNNYSNLSFKTFKIENNQSLYDFVNIIGVTNRSRLF
jgi:hypothetical protein